VRPPELIIVVPVEGDPKAYVGAETAEEATALKADLEARDVEQEVAELLDEAIPQIRARPPGVEGA
jgi:hypothetical protein